MNEDHRIIVDWDGQKKEVVARQGENLLAVLVRANLPVEFFCTTGKCTTCRLRVYEESGQVTIPSETERYRLGTAAVAQGYRLACQVYVDRPFSVFL